MDKIHDLINRERRKRKLPHVYWSREMARFARSQAEYCADRGYMIHSDRYAFQGGECLVGGAGSISPRQAVNSWLRSKQGHREYILSDKVKKAGVGVARRNGKMFVAWAFSNSPCSYPDCPAFKPKFKPIRIPNLFNLLSWEDRRMFNKLLGVVGLWGGILGAHGIYIHFSRWELFLSLDKADRLFLTFQMPVDFLSQQVWWMSNKGFESWFLPAIICFAGFWVFNKYLLSVR